MDIAEGEEADRMSIRRWISDQAWVRMLARWLFALGDSIRPIVQKPVILRMLGKQRIGSALDAGCGRGLYTRCLAKIADDVEAIDISHSHINAQLRRNRRSNVRPRLGSVTDLPYPDEVFDLVLHSEVLEHIPDDHLALSEIIRVLRPGGRLVISVPVPPAPIEDHEHVREGYHCEQIEALLRQSGFEVEQTEFCMYALAKAVIRLQSWWTSNMRIAMPSVFLLPAVVERWLHPYASIGLPYDVVIAAKKCVAAE